MEVVCLENETFYQLIKQVVERMKNDGSKVDNEWINDEEAMRLLDIKKSTLQTLRDTGKLRYSQPSKKIILYHKPSLLEYIEENARERF